MQILDIQINGGILILLVIAVIIISIYLTLHIGGLTNKVSQLETENTTIKSNYELSIKDIKKDIVKERDDSIQRIIVEWKGKAQESAQKWFEEWKSKELQDYKKVIDKNCLDAAANLLVQWKAENEDRIRKDAANRSVRNVLGKVTEHLIPFSEAMKQFNPKDIRFIGSPIDLIVFDGSEKLDGGQVTIHFIEVKTGTSALSKRQQLIRDAVENKRIEWLRVDMKNFGDSVNDALQQNS